MDDLKSKHSNVFSIIEKAKLDIESLLNDIKVKEDEYDTKVKEHEEDYATMVKQLETSIAAKLHELEESYSKNRKALETEKHEWEQEKKSIATSHTFEPRIKLDIGGTRFTTTLTTLTRFPDTMIGAMFSGRHQLTVDESGHYFIDRDGTHFRHILNYLRCPEEFDVESMDAGHVKELRKEVKYYGLDSLMQVINNAGRRRKEHADDY